MTDITRSGSREYDADQRARVLEIFARIAKPVSVETLARASGQPGRRVRQIMADACGVEFLLKGGDDGYDVAESYEDAMGYIKRIENQAFSMLERVHRMKDYANTLPRKQHQLL